MDTLLQNNKEIMLTTPWKIIKGENNKKLKGVDVWETEGHEQGKGK